MTHEEILRRLRQEENQSAGRPPRVDGFCLGCGRAEYRGAPLVLGWLQPSGSYSQIHDLGECRELYEAKAKAELAALLSGGTR